MSSWDTVWRLVRLAYWYVVRAAFKWFLHVCTGRSEIERWLQASSKTKHRSATVKGIENALLQSKDASLRQVADCCPPEHVSSAVSLVLKTKSVDIHLRPIVSRPLTLVLEQIVGYRRVIQLVETARNTPYDVTNRHHEHLLVQLWTLLMKEEPLDDRISAQWQDIGFQGTDPATDFRGMGLLGLEQLIYLARFDIESAFTMLHLSRHPKFGFPFAIAGITMTALSRELLNEGLLKSHFYNSVLGVPELVDFHRVYCRVFSLFCCAWKQTEPESVMQFNVVKDSFRRNLGVYLRRDDAKLDSLCNLSVICHTLS